jgi:hypothetical protein
MWPYDTDSRDGTVAYWSAWRDLSYWLTWCYRSILTHVDFVGYWITWCDRRHTILCFINRVKVAVKSTQWHQLAVSSALVTSHTLMGLRIMQHGSWCGICGTQSEIWKGFSPCALGVLCRYHSTITPYSFSRLSPMLYSPSKWNRRQVPDYSKTTATQ